uniref:Uncharacterized protein n=1 Tax=Physcomitrium patens TaxID=3218 RepID=A0A2K1KJE4_PHYPA|nr:hypothetical protein PHYPA_007573 [Physcomitrium patens]
MSAPASVPAAVAESQNVSLTAWSGVTRSNGKYIESGVVSVPLGHTSVVDAQSFSALATLVQDAEVSICAVTVSCAVSNIFLLAKVRDSGGLSVRQAPVTMAGWEFLRMEVEHTVTSTIEAESMSTAAITIQTTPSTTAGLEFDECK